MPISNLRTRPSVLALLATAAVLLPAAVACSASSFAADTSLAQNAAAENAASAADAQPLPPIETRRALIVCGHPGDDEHRALYAETVERLHAALTARFGFDAAEIRILFGTEAAADDGPALASARGLSTRENLETQAAELRQALGPNDGLWVIVLGHAHYDGRHSYLNLPGPDIHQYDFGKLFDGLSAREQVFFITTPASGFYIKPLSAQGRIVITATEADLEVNETIFHLALADVLTAPKPLEPDESRGSEDAAESNGPAQNADQTAERQAAAERGANLTDETSPEGDTDAERAASVSVFDLYIAIARNVAARYAEDELLATEHALLDDNGDGRGTEVQIDYLPPDQGGRPAGSPKAVLTPTADGALARRTMLTVSGK